MRVLVALGVVVLLALLSLPKLWLATPDGFRPVVRVSLLDLAQAWSLDRAAQRLAAAGQHRDAQQRWQAAVGNNPANAQLIRNTLEHFLSRSTTGSQPAIEMVLHTGWLLRLTETNRADRTLAARIYDHFAIPDMVSAMIEPVVDNLSPLEDALYLKALFAEAQWSEFTTRWDRRQAQFAQDPELRLYHAAYLAGWGPPGSVTDSRQQLEDATADPQLRTTARRLRLILLAKTLEVEAYGTLLTQLVAEQADELMQHLAYWRLLTDAGQKAEAQQLARTCPRQPRTPLELFQLASAHLGLGLTEEALETLRRYARELAGPGVPWGTRTWQLYTDLLITQRRWDQLRAAAYDLRVWDRARDILAGYSLYMEGRAEFGLDHFGQAATLFDRAAARAYPDPEVALEVAANLHGLKYPRAAWKVLRPHAIHLRTALTACLLMVEIQLALAEDASLLLQFAQTAYDLAPEDPVAVNHYASALLINQQTPEEAARLTRALLEAQPPFPPAAVTHALALALSRRLQEAELFLDAIPPAAVTGVAKSFFHLAWLEIHARSGQPQLAWADLDQLAQQKLFPNQVRWLETQRAQLPPRRAEPSADS